MRRLKRFGNAIWGLRRGDAGRVKLDVYLAELRLRMLGELEKDLTVGLTEGPSGGRWVRMKRVEGKVIGGGVVGGGVVGSVHKVELKEAS